MQVFSRLWRQGDKNFCRARVWMLLSALLCGLVLHRECQAEINFPHTAPAVLVDGPVNLTWAANHTSYWRERGVDGFLVYGLASEASPSEERPNDEESALLREVRIAQQRLRVAGLGRNFFHWDLGETWANTHEAPDGLRVQAAAVAAFARSAGLQGVAIRLPRDSAALRANVSAATYAATDLEEQAEQYHETGLRIIRELLRGHPHGEILLLAEAPLRAGRDWWALMAGIFAGPDAAAIPLHFVDLSSRALSRPLDYQERRASLDRHARFALSSSAADRWSRHRAPAFCVSLFEATEKGVAATHTLEASRLLGLAAAVYSDHYMVVQSPPGGLWEITDERATAYEALEQEIPVQATSPLLPQAHQLTLNTPLTRLKRVGVYRDDHGAPVFVFQGPEGAAVLFWGGLAAPTRLPSRSAMVTLWSPLDARTRSLVPEEGAIMLPSGATPLLVRGLPVSAWCLPAAMTLHFDQPFREALNTNGVTIRIANPLSIPLEANISLWAPEGIGAGRQAISLQLAPGAVFEARREIRGEWRAGDKLQFRLALTQPGSGMVTRAFDLEVAPALLWQGHLPAALSGPPSLLDSNSANPLMVGTSDNRYVSAYDASGVLAWEYDHGSGAAIAPMPTVGTPARNLALHSNSDGAILLLDRHGQAVTRQKKSGYEHGRPLALWDIRQGPAPYLLTLQDGNKLAALDDQGAAVWERNWKEGPALLPPQYPLASRDLPAAPLTLFFADAIAPHLEALDEAGKTLWRFEFPRATQWDVLQFFAAKQWQVALWDQVSQLWLLDGMTGRLSKRRISAALELPGPLELRPLPGEADVGLILYSRRHKTVLELDQAFAKATSHSLPEVDDLRGIRQSASTSLWGVRGLRALGLLPAWQDVPLSGSPSGLQIYRPADEPAAHFLVVGDTEMRVLRP